jgi:hypothetical protein
MDTSQIIQKIDWYKPTLCMFRALITSSSYGLIRLNILALIRVLFFIPFSLNFNSSKLVLISYFRNDLFRDFDLVINSLPKDYSTLEIKGYQNIKLKRLYINDVIFAFHESSKIIDHIQESPKNLILARGVIFLFILEGIKVVRCLYDKNIKVESILSLMEMQFCENIISQYFRLNGAKTFANQHGYYHDDGHHVTRKTYIPVNYLASVCETAFAWGEKNKILLEKYTKASVICVGKPSLLGAPSNMSYSNKNDVNIKPSHMVAILDGIILRDTNIEIMDSLSNYSKDDEIISFAPHPDDPYSYSQVNSNKISQNILNPKDHTIVANNSSAILQYGRAGFNILLYDKSSFCRVISKERLDMLPIIHKGDLCFYDMQAKNSIDIWKDFIYCSGDNCLRLILKSIA